MYFSAKLRGWIYAKWQLIAQRNIPLSYQLPFRCRFIYFEIEFYSVLIFASAWCNILQKSIITPNIYFVVAFPYFMLYVYFKYGCTSDMVLLCICICYMCYEWQKWIIFQISHRILCLNVSDTSRKRKCCHCDEIFITGCTGSCYFDNFLCSWRCKCPQDDRIFCFSECNAFSMTSPEIDFDFIHDVKDQGKGLAEIWMTSDWRIYVGV